MFAPRTFTMFSVIVFIVFTVVRLRQSIEGEFRYAIIRIKGVVCLLRINRMGCNLDHRSTANRIP